MGFLKLKSFLDMVFQRGHSKKYVPRGGRGSYKANENKRGEGSSISLRSLCEKNYLIFRTAIKRVLSDKLLGII